MLTFKFEAANVNFQQFWTFSTNFKILCCLTVFVVSEQVLNDLGRFCTTLIKKKFLLKEEFVLVLGHKKPFPSGFKHSVAVFDVFKRISIFVLFDRFGRLWASFEWLEAFWHKFGKQTICHHILFGLWSGTEFLNGFQCFSLVFDRFLIFWSLTVLLVCFQNKKIWSFSGKL